MIQKKISNYSRNLKINESFGVEQYHGGEVSQHRALLLHIISSSLTASLSAEQL